MTFTQSTLLWALVFVLVGASFYITDRKIGIKIYSKIRKWWHPPSAELVAQVERGFVYNRSNKVRWQWAALISGIQTAIMIGFRHEDPRVELMLFFVVTPATYIGIMIGPHYEKLKKLREKGFEKLDQVESGEIDVGAEVREAYEEKKKSLGAFWSGLIGSTGAWLGGIFSFGKPKVRASASPSSVTPSPAASAAESDDEDEKAVERARQALKGLNK